MKKLNRLFAAFFAAAFVASVLFVTGCSSSKVANGGTSLVMDSAIKQGKLDNGPTLHAPGIARPDRRHECEWDASPSRECQAD